MNLFKKTVSILFVFALLLLATSCYNNEYKKNFALGEENEIDENILQYDSLEDDINQIKTVESMFIQLIEKYEMDRSILQYASFFNIMKYLKYSFVENTKLIEIINDGYGDIIEININETIKLSITPIFASLHLTGGFTYCSGILYLNELEYNFYLVSRDHFRDDNNICFYYVDANENNFVYRVTYLINDYEILIITKYKNVYGYMEDPRCRISKVIYYDNRDDVIRYIFH